MHDNYLGCNTTKKFEPITKVGALFGHTNYCILTDESIRNQSVIPNILACLYV